MNVLSLFDGMACGMLAMMKADISVDDYFAYEIDKYAIQTVKHNFPNIQELGNVFNADFTKYGGVEYLIGGSPCTYWSIAQSPDRRETTASGMGWELFSQYVRALHEAKPKFFIYENNKSMSKAIYKSVSETFGFEPIMINSSLVSAQNRQRYYWVGKRNDDGTYSKVDVEQPKDRGILLRDIVDEPVNVTPDGKSQTIKAQYSNTDVNNICKRTSTYGASGVAEPVRCFTLPREDGIQTQSKQYRVYDIVGKSTTLCAEGGGISAKTGLYAIPVEFDGDTPTKAISYADGKTYKVYSAKDGFISIKDKIYPIRLPNGFYIIRKLTVSECKRLQTVPDWYEFPVSDTQAYKMLGNGWTVDVIAHLIKATVGGAMMNLNEIDEAAYSNIDILPRLIDDIDKIYYLAMVSMYEAYKAGAITREEAAARKDQLRALHGRFDIDRKIYRQHQQIERNFAGHRKRLESCGCQNCKDMLMLIDGRKIDE